MKILPYRSLLWLGSLFLVLGLSASSVQANENVGECRAGSSGRIITQVEQAEYLIGDKVRFCIYNGTSSSILLPNVASWQIVDSAGQMIHIPDATRNDVQLKPNVRREWAWESNNYASRQITPGTYYVVFRGQNLRVPFQFVNSYTHHAASYSTTQQSGWANYTQVAMNNPTPPPSYATAQPTPYVTPQVTYKSSPRPVTTQRPAAQLPRTGPAGALLTLVGLGSAVTMAGRYYRSKSALRKSINEMTIAEAVRR